MVYPDDGREAVSQGGERGMGARRAVSSPLLHSLLLDQTHKAHGCHVEPGESNL